MRKSSFLEGAMIATIGIIICKVIGLIYVIPFYSIIGSQGGALYGYAYSIYAIFLSLSSSGIPIAMSKVVSEYNSLEYYNTKEKAYKIGTTIIMALGFFFFIVLMIFAKPIAHLILGDLEGGNTIEGVTMVIRVVATALLIVPSLSVTKGYLQGHKFIAPSSISNVIEQLIRVIVIVGGSFMALKVLNLSLETAVGIAVFGATVGAISAYLYLLYKIRKNKEKLKKDEVITRAEAKITTKDILKKIVFYALPFVIIDLIQSAYSMVDTFTVVSTMANLGFGEIAETTIGVLSTWATKLNMIIISVALGIIVSLIPNIASSFVKQDMQDVSRKINQSLQSLLFVILPMTIGLSFLAAPTWVIFYGYDEVSITIFKLFIFQALTFSFYTILINIFQTMNNSKITLATLAGSFLGKVILNIPMMYFCKRIGIGVYYGPVIATLLTQGIAIIYLIYKLKSKYNVNYKTTLYNSSKTILCTAIMVVVLMIVNIFIKMDATTRLQALFEVAIFSIIGAFVYITVAFKSRLVHDILGDRFLAGIKARLPFINKKHKKVD
jgi:O-antigen/teichoic acid export membrane protein